MKYKFEQALKEVEEDTLIKQIRHFREAVDACIFLVEKNKREIEELGASIRRIQEEIARKQAFVEKFEELRWKYDDLVDECEEKKLHLEGVL